MDIKRRDIHSKLYLLISRNVPLYLFSVKFIFFLPIHRLTCNFNAVETGLLALIATLFSISILKALEDEDLSNKLKDGLFIIEHEVFEKRDTS